MSLNCPLLLGKYLTPGGYSIDGSGVKPDAKNFKSIN